jgi:hypothetical protein
MISHNHSRGFHNQTGIPEEYIHGHRLMGDGSCVTEPPSRSSFSQPRGLFHARHCREKMSPAPSAVERKDEASFSQPCHKPHPVFWVFYFMELRYDTVCGEGEFG